MSGRLAGRTAVVTGCGSGIGLAITRRFLAEGASVVGLDVNPAAAEALGHDRLTVRTGSVAEPADVAGAIAAATESGDPLDVMINNAAIQLERGLDETTVEDFDALVAVNLRGVFLGTKLAAEAMRPARRGAIVNLGSILGFTGDPLLAAYTATKGGVVNFTRSAALTYAPDGIRVNCLCPGAVRTELTTRVWDLAPDPAAARRRMESLYPMRRIVEPEEVAAAALFLASDEASAVCGASLVVDCGLTAGNPELALLDG
jgi:NAD(P)-dependent dehydrogenase (short-subunit alcohol dehydrogenase family)